MPQRQKAHLTAFWACAALLVLCQLSMMVSWIPKQHDLLQRMYVKHPGAVVWSPDCSQYDRHHVMCTIQRGHRLFVQYPDVKHVTVQSTRGAKKVACSDIQHIGNTTSFRLPTIPELKGATALHLHLDEHRLNAAILLQFPTITNISAVLTKGTYLVKLTVTDLPPEAESKHVDVFAGQGEQLSQYTCTVTSLVYSNTRHQLKCTMPDQSGSNIHFQLRYLRRCRSLVSATSIDFTALHLESVQSPSRGLLRIQGQGFGTSPSAVAVTLSPSGASCGYLIVSPTSITCLLLRSTTLSAVTVSVPGSNATMAVTLQVDAAEGMARAQHILAHWAPLYPNERHPYHHWAAETAWRRALHDAGVIRIADLDPVPYLGPAAVGMTRFGIFDLSCSPTAPFPLSTPRSQMDRMAAEERAFHARPHDNVTVLYDNTCAVVGSGGSLRGSRLGPAIDDHDVVIRVNCAPTRGFEADVGQKETVRVLMPESHDGKYVERMCGTGVQWDDVWVFAKPGKERDVDYWNTVSKYSDSFDPRDFFFPPAKTVPVSPRRILMTTHCFFDRARHEHRFRELRTMPEQVPSSGTIALFAALHMCSSVDVYGMSTTALKTSAYPKYH